MIVVTGKFISEERFEKKILYGSNFLIIQFLLKNLKKCPDE
jgi:hypothetical protein